MPTDEATGRYTMNPGHGKAMKKAYSKRQLTSIDIQVAENGWTARCNYKDPIPKKGEAQVYLPAKEHVFSSKDKLLKFVTDQLA